MVYFQISGVAGVVAEWRKVIQEKYTGRGASSRRFVQKNGEIFFCGRCNTGEYVIFYTCGKGGEPALRLTFGAFVGADRDGVKIARAAARSGINRSTTICIQTTNCQTVRSD